MTSKYSIAINWYNELRNNFENWENLGRTLIEENCKHKTQDQDKNKDNRETNMRYSGWCEECGFSEDSAEPMMNYGYPLAFAISNDKILKVVQKTNLTIMHKIDTDEYFLTLTGGGMDLSQDIALAYLIAIGRIPPALALEVSMQEGLSVSRKNYRKIMKEIKRTLRQESNNYKFRIKQINEIMHKKKEGESKAY